MFPIDFSRIFVFLVNKKQKIIIKKSSLDVFFFYQ